MNSTIVRFTEQRGLCFNSGTMEIEHDFVDEEELMEYLRLHWFNLESADRITDILVDRDTRGDFSLKLELE